MQRDAHNLVLTNSSVAATRAFDHALSGYLTYRADTGGRVAALLAADPEFALGHCFKGYMMMLGFKQALVPVAREAAAAALNLAGMSTPREKAHVAALGTWIAGDLDRTLAIWEEILDQHPHDVLAFRLHHFNAFWLGRAEAMQATVEQVLPKWSPQLPGYGSLLACRAFAHEECGSYTVAEAAGRQAIEIDRGDVWAAHAVAHVMEMQGRRSEGIAWLTALEPQWEGANNLTHHLWWHLGLFHLEHGAFDKVLALYDRQFRNLESPLTLAQPDLYIDVQNAVSMLFRLERQGVDVGERWGELARHAEDRIGDCLSAFTLPHWMMALARCGRWDAAGRMLDGMRAAGARNHGTLAPLIRDFAMPISEAVVAHAKGDFARSADLMRPVIGGMYRLGGSHAQQDVLEQLYLDAALKAGRRDDVRLLLERVMGRYPAPPERRIGYADAARGHAH